MIGLTPRPGGFAWLVLHELRLSWRARARGTSGLIGGAILLVYVCIGAIVAANLVDWRLAWSPSIGVALFLGTIAAFTLMVAQAMLASQRTLYEMRDLDLLLTSPMSERRVLSAKLTGIAAGISLTYAVLLLPLLVPFALLGHPRLFGAVWLIVAVPLAAAAVGLGLTLILARTVGPRAARTVGQILAALLGGGFYLASQLTRLLHDDARGLYGWAQHHDMGVAGASSLPGRAAFGDPGALAAMLVPSVMLFAAAGWFLRTAFLGGYQDAGMRLVRPRANRNATGKAFHASLRRAIFAKEWKLLSRDPALAFQIVLRLIYLVPLLAVGLRHGAGTHLAPTLAFASVLIASQLAGSLAWLTVSAEDAPDLLTAAPVAKATVDHAKLSAALTMTVPLAAPIPLAMAILSPLGAVVTLLFTAVAAWCCGLVELHLGKPGERARFARRRQGSFVSGLLGLLVAAVFGGLAAGATALLA